MEKSKEIFGNEMPKKVYRKAVRTKKKNIRRFGDDSGISYQVKIEKNKHIGDCLGVMDVRLSPEGEGKGDTFDVEKGLIVGNIRMGFGHYRISMAIASAANAMGYIPYWMDLNSYKHTTCTKVISAQNDLYSLGSRISAKSRIFNRLVWEPLNYEGFRKLSYNASDQKNAELMAPVFGNIPKQIPVVATHVWPAQAAIHGGMKNVVNAIPDNWPMALHLAEGSLHTVQTHFAYQGYRILNGMKGKDVLHPMPAGDLVFTGHYVDHELVSNLEQDCKARRERKKAGAPMRFLLTIGGAGAQKEIFAAIIRHMLPAVEKGQAALYINVGDYKNVWEELVKELPELGRRAKEHFDDWDETRKFCEEALCGPVEGIHGFYHADIFEAVYCTNLLMRSCDVLVTKPSELAFYPVPKLFIKRVGGHEQWGAVHSAELGDGTLECEDIPHTLQMLELFLREDTLFCGMCDAIENNKKAGIYDGAYRVVELAAGMRRA
ncbi:MAG TPA: hypothetical protein H9742_04510 [Candidatus Acetatifactor stercoripullorum]|uniref:Uncharacterized protein n=1 Tax=Candidatus Acetatifactor stercoripullorum TaxID=2838414 RepID=A0A9D1R4J0_9FIRM|nr:hypothetical protein [uncultured Acetatifactor sp.]HIW80784.1 hypothetical protein [Candidatus Acetatifactor stercoripullorum]